MKTILRTFTGVELDLADLDPSLIRVADIAHSLAWQCRYNGHAHTWYSVAQHCSAGCRYAEKHYPDVPYLDLAFLIHDAPEYISGDNPTPWKTLNPQGRAWEKKTLPLFAKRFYIPNWEELEPLVAKLDKEIVPTEIALFLDRTVDITQVDKNWSEAIGPPLDREQAEMDYINTYARMYDKYKIKESSGRV